MVAGNPFEKRGLLAATGMSDDEEGFWLNAKGPAYCKVTCPKPRIRIKSRFHARIQNISRYCQIGRPLWRLVRLIFPALCLVGFVIFLICYYFDRSAALTDWPKNASLNTADYVRPGEMTNLLAPHDMCQNETFLTIIVFSGQKNFKERQTIRETWGNTTLFGYSKFSKLHTELKGKYLEADARLLQLYADYFSSTTQKAVITKRQEQVRVVFFLGRANETTANSSSTSVQELIEHEAQTWNDIIQEDFIDTYNNLTVKATLALKYMSSQCLGKTKFVMKCDDDTFVNVPNLLHILLGGTIPVYEDTLEFHDSNSWHVLADRNRLNLTSGLLLGHAYCNAIAVSELDSKWYMPAYMYADYVYPKFLSGAGYVMSMDIVEKLYKTALNTSLVYLEDVFLTGICAKKAHLPRQAHPLFSPIMSKKECSFRGLVIQHHVKGDLMRQAWNFVSNYTLHCKPLSEVSLFKWFYITLLRSISLITNC